MLPASERRRLNGKRTARPSAAQPGRPSRCHASRAELASGHADAAKGLPLTLCPGWLTAAPGAKRRQSSAARCSRRAVPPAYRRSHVPRHGRHRLRRPGGTRRQITGPARPPAAQPYCGKPRWDRALITAAPAARVPAPNGDGRARPQLRDRNRRTWPRHCDRNCGPGQRHRDRHGRCRLPVPKARRAEDSRDRDRNDHR
jgi:hypothetical protein